MPQDPRHDPYTRFDDVCSSKRPRGSDPTHCGATITHRVRTLQVDARIRNPSYSDANVYTPRNRPRYRRCFSCAAKLFERGRVAT